MLNRIKYAKEVNLLIAFTPFVEIVFLKHYFVTHCGHGSLGSGHGQTTLGSAGFCSS